MKIELFDVDPKPKVKAYIAPFVAEGGTIVYQPGEDHPVNTMVVWEDGRVSLYKVAGITTDRVPLQTMINFLNKAEVLLGAARAVERL